MFEERVDDLLVAAKNLTRENKLEDAKTVCEKFIEYWNGQKTIDKNQESEVRKAVLRVRKSLEETDLLLAGQLKGKQK